MASRPQPSHQDCTTDEELLRRIAAGEPEALVQFFRKRRDDLYRFALHMTGSPATAEDITQDVFLTVMRDARRFEPSRGAAVAWVLGIARNLVRRRLVRDRVLAPLTAVDRLTPPLITQAGDPTHAIEQSQQVAALRRAVMALPVRYREVVLLCDLEELSYQDAAAALHCAVGTVRSRLHRARALLATKLGKGADGRKPAIAIA